MLDAHVFPIQTPAEYGRQMDIVAQLVAKPEEEITAEEGRLLELLSLLIEAYEDRVHPLPKTRPHKMLEWLLEHKGMKPTDLWSVLPKSRVSEILNGKRSISKVQARQLADFFSVPLDLFL